MVCLERFGLELNWCVCVIFSRRSPTVWKWWNDTYCILMPITSIANAYWWQHVRCPSMTHLALWWHNDKCVFSIWSDITNWHTALVSCRVRVIDKMVAPFSMFYLAHFYSTSDSRPTMYSGGWSSWDSWSKFTWWADISWAHMAMLICPVRAKTSHWSTVGLMLVHHLRLWSSICTYYVMPNKDETKLI